MTRHAFHAMGTTIAVYTSQGSARARTMFEHYEQIFSRFLDDSELSAVNRKGHRGVRVSNDMREMLIEADRLRQLTDGLVDISVGAVVNSWGYDRTFDEVVSRSDRPAHLRRGAWAINGNRVTLERGTKLDLGGVAKGWTCDRVVESGAATIASAGGDMRSKDPSLVADVVDPASETVIEVPVGIGALATSSTAKRRWAVAGGEAHHIIDPRTLAPAGSPVISASATSDTAAMAEAGAKAVLLKGVDGLAWADAQPWIRTAMVVWHDGSIYANTVRMAS